MPQVCACSADATIGMARPAAACSARTLLRVKRVLLTGMSGTGKSSVVREAVEPLLRRVADHEIRTTIPLDEVVTAILRLVDA